MPSHPCSCVRKAGGEILVLNPELELVLQRGRNNSWSQSQSSPFLIPYLAIPYFTILYLTTPYFTTPIVTSLLLPIPYPTSPHPVAAIPLWVCPTAPRQR